MQHGHHPLPSPRLSTTVPQQPDSHPHLSTPHHHLSSQSHRSPFQTNFPAPPSSGLINDPTSHSSSRRSIPSPLQNHQYHQTRFSTDFNPPRTHNHYQPYPAASNDPYFHQSRYPANNETSPNPNCPPMLYMHDPPPPTHAPYYPYHTPPSISTQPNPDHLHQYPHQHPHPPPTMLPPPPVEQLRYTDNYNAHHTFPVHPVPQVSSAQTHVFGNENTFQPTQTLPGNLSIPENTSKPPDSLKPLANLPPLRNPPARVNQSYYPVVQGPQNMTSIIPPSRSVLPSVPYHQPHYMSPNIPPQNLQQVPDATHFYNNPYHHNVQTGLSTEQHFQRAPVNNLQWQPNLAPATHVRPPTDGGDGTYAFPSYYVGPDGVTRYISQQAAPRKKRLQWTSELHDKFVKAVEEFGVETAVPKMLLQAMNVPGLTRENVASHLQKYRESIRKRKLVERSNIGTKMDSKESDRSKLLSNVDAKDDLVDGGHVEARADKHKRSSEREDSSKRLRDIEGETSEKTNSKRQKSVSNTEGEAVKGSGLTEQEVESYARVRARVDETLQLQAFRERQRDKEPDVT